MNEQISNVARKLAKYVPIMYASRLYCSIKCNRLIHNRLVYSKLINCNSIWGFCTKTELQPLYIMQKKIVRSMACVTLYEPSQQIVTELSLLMLDNIDIYMTALFVYKCLHNLHFTHWFRQRSSNYHTRFNQTAHLFAPRISNKHSERCISYRRPKI